MLNKFRNVTDDALIDLLARYTKEYTSMLLDEEQTSVCKDLVDEIIAELAVRKISAERVKE